MAFYTDMGIQEGIVFPFEDAICQNWTGGAIVIGQSVEWDQVNSSGNEGVVLNTSSPSSQSEPYKIKSGVLITALGSVYGMHAVALEAAAATNGTKFRVRVYGRVNALITSTAALIRGAKAGYLNTQSNIALTGQAASGNTYSAILFGTHTGGGTPELVDCLYDGRYGSFK